MADSTDSNLVVPTSTIVNPSYIENVDAFPVNNDPARLNQQQILPVAVKGRLMLPVQTFPNITTVSAFVPNGSSVVAATTTQVGSGGLILQTVAYQVYINNISSSTRMPEAVSSSSYPFYVWDTLYDIDGRSLLNQPSVAVKKIQIRNNSGSGQVVIIQALTRFVANGSGAASIAG